MLRKLPWFVIVAILAGLAGAAPANPAAASASWAAAGRPTRMLAAPAISADRIAFVYAGDLWTAGLDGAHVQRLTTDGGVERDRCHPEFSPDGTAIAFSAARGGNEDVFVIPAEGGQAQQLTWHPGADLVQGFTPDGKAVLFASERAATNVSQTSLYTVPVEGGFPQAVAAPPASHAAYAADGQTLAYNPFADEFTVWKGYRGGAVSVIWLYEGRNGTATKVPQPAGGSNDAGPMWLAGKLYFRSDRDGEFNIYAYDPASRRVSRVTAHEDFPVLNAAAGAGKIVYEQAGQLHLLDPAAGTTSTLSIVVNADLRELREQYVPGSSYVSAAAISPSGGHAVFEMRGDIVIAPTQKGEPRNLTNTAGVAERTPSWSPDGQWIAYFSDATGEYELTLERSPSAALPPKEGDRGRSPSAAPGGKSDGRAATRRFKLEGAGFYEAPAWSPDAAHLAYRDQTCTLYVLTIASGEIRRVAHDSHCSRQRNITYDWAPDGAWLAYTLARASDYKDIYIYNLADATGRRITDGMVDADNPAFDASGQFLYFTASRDAGPAMTRLDMMSLGEGQTQEAYIVLLQAGTPSPFISAVDPGETVPAAGPEPEILPAATPRPEGTPTTTPPAAAPGAATATPTFGQTTGRAAAPTAAPRTPTPAPAGPEPAGPPGREAISTTLSIDFDGIAGRILPLPVDSGRISNLQGGAAGQIFYLRDGSLYAFDLAGQNETKIAEGLANYQLSADGSHFLGAGVEGWTIGSTGGGPGDGVALDITLHVDPAAEWRQMYDEAWRINRDFFYDANLHGVDWQAMRQKYAQFLPDLATRSDLDRLLSWLLSELRVGHHWVAAPFPRYINVTSHSVGLLGADYTIENGRYRVQKVYGRQPWTPELKAPLAEPGAEVRAGEYLLAVNGEPLTAADNIYRRFINLAGQVTELEVGPAPDGAGARTISVTPIGDESELRHWDWVEGNRRRVDEASGGRVAYVYMPDTGSEGLALFQRYFFPQVDRQALIVDDRFNVGGQYADYVIDLLTRQGVANLAFRGGADTRIPSAYIAGPKVMLINEASASGGDLMPWAFHKLGAGELIGKRTWGGAVGLSSYPALLDGGQVTAPDFGIYDGSEWIIENRGVAPDVEVEQAPAEVLAGKDPQLERAIKFTLDELAAKPVKTPQRPAYPLRNGKSAE